jgi:hypothetical protein
LRHRTRQRSLAICGLALAAAVLGACGGATPKGPQTVSGDGFSFTAPAGWQVDRTGGRITAVPERGEELLWVSLATLRRRYRQALWPKVVPELDKVAAQLAAQLRSGRLVARRTVVVAGRRARSYDIDYEGTSGSLVERIAFVLEGKREYQLLCRWRVQAPELGKTACAAFIATFRLV